MQLKRGTPRWVDTVEESTMDTLPPTGDWPDLPDVQGSDAAGTYGATLDPRPGMVLADRYELIEPIGRGASGWVWKARHVMIGKQFAIKLLATRTGSFDDEAAIRMLREANTLSRVDHPNVTAVTDFGHARQGGTPFIVMELLEGQPLRSVLDARRLSWRQARVWGVQILEGVEAAHAKGIVHRDIKPANLFVTAKDDRIKVLDFGLAQAQVHSDAKADRATGRLVLSKVFGTPSTMSPEQIAGRELDARTDLYSLGCVLYEMIAGEPPVKGEAAEILYQHVYVETTPLRELAPPDVPDAVCTIVDRCLRKEPSQRPANVTEVYDVFDLRKVRREKAAARSASRRPRPWRYVTGAAVAAGTLLALVAARPTAPKVSLDPVTVDVPSHARASFDAPSLHADLPVFERARPKQAVTPEPLDPPKRAARRSHRTERRSPSPAAQATPPRVAKSGPTVNVDPKVPELKNPFGG